MPLPSEILEELRERFRKENPNLDLPPARKLTEDEIKKKREEILREEKLRLKAERIKQVAENKPSFIANALKKYIDLDKKQR